MEFSNWLNKWHIPLEARLELRALICPMQPHLLDTRADRGELFVQNQVRLAAGVAGWGMWRNNVGALTDKTGRLVRYGLCNDSGGLNAEFKSGDLIGCKPVVITPDHVGKTIGQFVSRECKSQTWKPGNDPERERAQRKWALLIQSLGGDAKFTRGEL